MPRKALSLIGGGLFACIAGIAIGPAKAEEFLHFPVDCTLGKDCFIQQYVDRDPGSGAVDFTCGPLSYDNHSGTDIRLTNAEAMRAGVNVLSATPGTVLGVRDGLPDTLRRTKKARELPCGNGVLIGRADGWRLQYCHLKQGSVTVKKGDTVQAGTVLGQVGLSGRTQFPHLHLTVRDEARRVIDPMDTRLQTHSCRLRDDEDLWLPSISVEYQPGGALHAGFTDGVPEYSAIKDGAAAEEILPRNAPGIVFWAEFFGVRRDDIIALEITDPDGRLFTEDQYRMEKTRAVQFRAAGRRSRGAWTPGTYKGTATLIRDGSAISTIMGSVEIR